MMRHDILLLDNNAVRQLMRPSSNARRALRANLRATWREFWPSALNVLEALQCTDPSLRIALLRTLGGLAGTNHVLALPGEILKRIAVAVAAGEDSHNINEPSLSILIREPDAVQPHHVDIARDHLRRQEDEFRGAAERSRVELRTLLSEAGGRNRWPDLSTFLDEMWSERTHLSTYVEELWLAWGLTGRAPVDRLLLHPAWRLYLEGWGAAAYAVSLAHPQPRWTGTTDLKQLVYLAFPASGVLATDDEGLRSLGNGMLRCRYPLAEVVPLSTMLQ